MADLYGTSPSSAAGLSSGTEDFSSFLNQHFSNSASPYSYASSPCMPFKGKQSRLLDSQSGGQFLQKQETASAPGSSSLAGSASGLNFSDPGIFLSDDIKGKAENLFSFTRVEDCDANASLKKGRLSPDIDLGDFSCDSENGADESKFPSNSMASRSSSKRSRAAEVHNLSEKRRRKRINEKMKALQNLIPNSNKTDKASMLDDAIEYLKQLQLQVQMLSTRNGFSLHPSCLQGRVQPMQMPQLGMNFEFGNAIPTSIRELETLFANKDCPIQSNFSLSNKCSLSDQPVPISTEANDCTPDNSFRFGQLQAYYGHYNLPPQSEDISRDTISKQLDWSQTGKNSKENGL